jgi:hypothetical protein
VSIANAGEGSFLISFIEGLPDKYHIRRFKMLKHKIVSHDEWLQARKELLAKEKNSPASVMP